MRKVCFENIFGFFYVIIVKVFVLSEIVVKNILFVKGFMIKLVLLYNKIIDWKGL